MLERATVPGARARERVRVGETFGPSQTSSVAGRGQSSRQTVLILPPAAGRKEPVLIHVLLLLACAVVIYLACEWFVNAVEWLGVRLKVGPVAVGTILAAVGTALPESVVTLVAVLFGSQKSGADIGV